MFCSRVGVRCAAGSRGEALHSDMSGDIVVSVGVVVIGRNEGERLRRCLESVVGASERVVYVDSGSSDNSVSVADSFVVDIVELDRSRPFSAARARNEGFQRLLHSFPNINLVQFLDGDCTLLPGWIEVAANALNEEPKRAAVMGHLQERNSDASLYNRLCALEWQSAPGDLKDPGRLGGISMMRVEIFRELGGFRPDVIAGEDSELGVRMALAGYKLTKIDRPMATHDASIMNFRQWWWRAVRAGHAIGQRSNLNGRSAIRDCVRERNSTCFWGMGLPVIVLVTMFFRPGVSLFLLTAYPMLWFRIWNYRRNLRESSREAALYATFTTIGKFANALGLIKFSLNKLARHYEIIEYK